MMKWYIAGRFEDKARLFVERARVRQAGHTVVSTWLDEEETIRARVSDSLASQYATRDLVEIKASDGIILDTITEDQHSGREVEWGIALTRPGTRYRIIVGPKRNVFHEMASNVFATWDEVIGWLRAAKI